MKKKVLADRYLKMFKSIALGVILSTAGTSAVFAADRPADADNFYRSDKVEVQKVTFKNQYKMNIAGNLYLPKDMDKSKKHAAIIVGHPMGAVKEQSADLYAVKMAERGFVTMSVDLAFWGGSDGQLRNAVAPELYAETFSAAVDYLGTGPFADREKIGAIGICGSGSFAISAAKIDPRLKAVATISMYDMGAANRNGLNHSLTLAQRKQIIAMRRSSVMWNSRVAQLNTQAGPYMRSRKSPILLNANSMIFTVRQEENLLLQVLRRF